MHRAGPPITVVDTVGAGDAFIAGFLARLHQDAELHPDRLHRITDHGLQAALDRGNRAAAITCTRGRRRTRPAGRSYRVG